MDDEARDAMGQLLDAETKLDENEHIVVASPEIRVEVGTAPSVGVGQQEFIYVNLNVNKSAEDRYGTVPLEARTGTSEARSEGSTTAKIDDSDRAGLNGYDDHTIAIFVAIRYGSGQWELHPVPGHVRRLDRPTRLLAAVNVLGLLKSGLEAGIAGIVSTVRFIFSGWRPSTHDMTVRYWGREGQAQCTGSSVTNVVFVHGIFSNHTRFDECRCRLTSYLHGPVEFYYVDYDCYKPLIKNGKGLARALENAFEKEDNVYVVAHSMGGLVTRIACLKRPLCFLRGVFLIATPNHGVQCTASLSILAHMDLNKHRILRGIRSALAGILNLTRVGEVMKDIKCPSQNTRGQTDYVTIPGRYFYPSRGVLDHDIDERWKVKGFFVSLKAVLPLLGIRVDRPHDGIVEERSNCLIPDVAERTSEKRRSVRGLDRFASRAEWENVTYAHIVPDSAMELCHMKVTDDKLVLRLVAEIMNAKSLSMWLKNHRNEHEDVNVYLWNGDAPTNTSRDGG